MKRIFFVALFIATSVNAEPVTQAEVQKAQGAMLMRQNDEAYAVAKSLGLSADYVSFCHTSLNMATDRPNDGHIPFGVNYRTITDSEMLNTVIETRRAYETVFMRLCLSDARAKLNAAKLAK